jgi:hypothetical protein
LNNNSYIMQTGWAAGGKVGYDFVGPRVEVEALYHSNYGSGVRAFPNGYATINGQIQQVSLLANILYDFFPGARGRTAVLHGVLRLGPLEPVGPGARHHQAGG